MLGDLKRVKDKVAYILENIPETSDSDKLLWLKFLDTFYDLKHVIGQEAYNKFRSLLLSKNTPTMESVRRVRQKFQETGLYQGSLREEKMEEDKATEKEDKTMDEKKGGGEEMEEDKTTSDKTITITVTPSADAIVGK